MEQQIADKKTALLVMDIQEATVKMLKDSNALMRSLTRAIQIARSGKVPVIYVVVGFRKGYPEVSRNNKSFSAMKGNGERSFDTEEASRVHTSVAAQPGDVIVVKKRISAFTGSDLDLVLRSLEITHIVLSGISTSGVVLSTLREAADKDYAITVLSDCCADLDEEVHHVLLNKVFTRQAEVIKTEEWSVR